MNKVLLIAIFIVVSCSKSKSQLSPDKKMPIVAYRTCDGTSPNEIDFSQFTHLHYAFINPDSLGTEMLGTECLEETVKLAHAANVKVLASIGGGSSPAYYTALLKAGNRAKIVELLKATVTRFNLDGIDVDLEGERIDENYEAFVSELSAALKPLHKLVTAAIATVYKSQFTDQALSHFDYMTIMSYDRTGPWNPDDPGPHSPYSMALEDADYWVNTRHIDKSKLYLGVPFYGYSFGPTGASSMSYKGIVAQYPGAENADELKMQNGSTLYYNGLPTIRKKAQLAKSRLGGLMLWQLSGDSKDGTSLLKAMNEEVAR